MTDPKTCLFELPKLPLEEDADEYEDSDLADDDPDGGRAHVAVQAERVHVGLVADAAVGAELHHQGHPIMRSSKQELSLRSIRIRLAWSAFENLAFGYTQE